MIEARELRIGNFCNIPVVRLNDLNIIEVLGQTIVKVDADFIKMVAERRIDFSPIPITHEWLIALGFKKTCNGGSTSTYQNQEWYCPHTDSFDISIYFDVHIPYLEESIYGDFIIHIDEWESSKSI